MGNFFFICTFWQSRGMHSSVYMFSPCFFKLPNLVFQFRSTFFKLRGRETTLRFKNELSFEDINNYVFVNFRGLQRIGSLEFRGKTEIFYGKQELDKGF